MVANVVVWQDYRQKKKKMPSVKQHCDPEVCVVSCANIERSGMVVCCSLDRREGLTARYHYFQYTERSAKPSTADTISLSSRSWRGLWASKVF